MKKVVVDIWFPHDYYDILDYTSVNYRSLYSYDLRKEKCLRVDKMKTIYKKNIEEIEEKKVLLSQVEKFCVDNLHENDFETNKEKKNVLNMVGENYSEVADCEVKIVENFVQDLHEPKSGDCKSDAHVNCMKTLIWRILSIA